MNYSNNNYTENFIKFKKISKGIGKVGKGAVKAAPSVFKGGLKGLQSLNPLSALSSNIIGGNSGNYTIMSYVCSALICLILVAYIIFQLKK